MLTLQNSRLWFRPFSKAVVPFTIGKHTQLFPDWMPGPLELHTSLQSLTDPGCVIESVAGDWLAYAWLDKTTDHSDSQKFQRILRRLLDLQQALAGLTFSTMNDIAKYVPALANQSPSHPIPLCETFCRAIFERALLDGLCRFHRMSFWTLLHHPEIGLPSLSDSLPEPTDLLTTLPRTPSREIQIRHTVGLQDPLTDAEAVGAESLHSVVHRTGIRFFKIKVCGQPSIDLPRLSAIQTLLESVPSTITIDGNEAFDDAHAVLKFVQKLESSIPSLFSRTLFLEQPLPRELSLREEAQIPLRQIANILPLVIDEADDHPTAFQEAWDLGYSGVSHKNCKGVIKSFLNLARIQNWNQSDRSAFLTGEDLTNVPLVPLHQDLTVAAALGLQHLERNGHHYFPDLTCLPFEMRQQMCQDYPSLYQANPDGSQMRLRIQDGQLDLSQLQCVGLGVNRLPSLEGLIPGEQLLTPSSEASASGDSTSGASTSGETTTSESL